MHILNQYRMFAKLGTVPKDNLQLQVILCKACKAGRFPLCSVHQTLVPIISNCALDMQALNTLIYVLWSSLLIFIQ